VKVGVIGCGVISRQYVENARAFDSFELVACADLDREARALRIPTKPATHSNRKPATDSDLKPAGVPI